MAAEEILDEVGQPVAELFPDGARGAAGGAAAQEFRRFLDRRVAGRLRRPAAPLPDVAKAAFGALNAPKAAFATSAGRSVRSAPTRSITSSRTRSASAWPLVAFITAPTIAPAAAHLAAADLLRDVGLRGQRLVDRR